MPSLKSVYCLFYDSSFVEGVVLCFDCYNFFFVLLPGLLDLSQLWVYGRKQLDVSIPVLITQASWGLQILLLGWIRLSFSGKNLSYLHTGWESWHFCVDWSRHASAFCYSKLTKAIISFSSLFRVGWYVLCPSERKYMVAFSPWMLLRSIVSWWSRGCAFLIFQYTLTS